MRKNKILVTASLLLASSLIFTACGENEVEKWQQEESFGEISEVEIEDVDSFAIADENDIIKKYINIEEENRNKKISTGVFLQLWNKYSSEDGDSYIIEKWENKDKHIGYKNFTETKVVMKELSEVYIYGTQADGMVKDITIMINPNIDVDKAYKYCILSYYVLCPNVSESVINRDMEALIKNKDRTSFITNSTNKKQFKITKTNESNGKVQIEISYRYDMEPELEETSEQ